MKNTLQETVLIAYPYLAIPFTPIEEILGESNRSEEEDDMAGFIDIDENGDDVAP